ncbi:MAG: SPOR domain-containing protein [Woeseiaceae bacterium]
MARRRRKRKSRKDEYPGWVWMLFGLAIGLSVAFAIYINDRTPHAPVRPVAEQPSNIDNNSEQTASQAEKSPESRFDFYSMLPNFEVVIPEQEPDVRADSGPQAVVEPGIYVLQAGSFTKYEDADRRRAQLALQGIESRIQRVTIDDKTYHRVRIGPIDDLDRLNVLRSRLRQAQIDVLRIRLGD